MSVLAPAPSPAFSNLAQSPYGRLDLPPIHHAIGTPGTDWNQRSPQEWDRKRKASDIETKHLSIGSLSSTPSYQASHPQSLPNLSPSPQISQQLDRSAKLGQLPHSPSGAGGQTRLVHITQQQNRSTQPLSRNAIRLEEHQQSASVSSDRRHLPPGSTLSYVGLLQQERSTSTTGSSSMLDSSRGSPMRPYTPYTTSEASPHIRQDTVGSSRSSHPSGVAITTSGEHTSYKMMTLKTSDGMIQVPVDVQAASRVADEKRKRNAGASARFRQRRKEKEVEASDKIRKLEQQVQDLTEDAEFYRRERDHLASITMQQQGCSRHFPRPQSPRHHRKARSNRGSSMASELDIDYVQEKSDDNGHARNVRRRTTSHGSIHTPMLPSPAGDTHTYAATDPHHQSPQPSSLYARSADFPHPPVDIDPILPTRLATRGQLPPLSSFPFPAHSVSPTTGPRNPFSRSSGTDQTPNHLLFQQPSYQQRYNNSVP